ncbi:MAG: hypothetical protein FWD66_08515 [Paludibacter sp.]|nr:hypothetical protein [Paludibacter sp.]
MADYFENKLDSRIEFRYYSLSKYGGQYVKHKFSIASGKRKRVAFLYLDDAGFHSDDKYLTSRYYKIEVYCKGKMLFADSVDKKREIRFIIYPYKLVPQSITAPKYGVGYCEHVFTIDSAYVASRRDER